MRTTARGEVAAVDHLLPAEADRAVLQANVAAARASRGRPIVNMFPLQQGEKITVVLPLTGEFSQPGTAAKEGYEVWVEMVNDAGGLLERLGFVGALKRAMATTGYSDLKEFQRVEVVVAPYQRS